MLLFGQGCCSFNRGSKKRWKHHGAIVTGGTVGSKVGAAVGAVVGAAVGATVGAAVD